MRVLLIHPRFPYRGKDLFPLGLGYIAALIREFSQVHVIDEIVEEFDLDFFNKINPDIVGITATTPSFGRALELVGIIKKENPETRVVMGGVHVSFKPEEALKAGVDVVVRGEGEFTFQGLVRNWDLENVQGISYMKDGIIVHNPDRELISDLDSIPFPAWDFFPLKAYGIISLTTSRGCSYACSYCSATRFWKRRIRMRSPENVFKEIEELRKLGFKLIRFMDSTFTLDKRRAMEIIDLIGNSSSDYKYSIETRADHLDGEILDALAKTGCNLICLGVDSGSQDVLDKNNRNIDIETIKQAIREIKKRGIGIRAYVTFGFPGESRESLRETISLLEETRPQQILLSLATIYPGTDLEDGKSIGIHPNWIKKFSGHGQGGRLYFPDTLTRRDYTKLGDYMFREIKRINKENIV